MRNEDEFKISPAEKRRIMKRVNRTVKSKPVIRLSFKPAVRVAIIAAVVVCLSVGIGAAVIKYTPTDTLEYLTETFSGPEQPHVAGAEEISVLRVAIDEPIVVENENVRLSVSEVFSAGGVIWFKAVFTPLTEGFLKNGAAYTLHSYLGSLSHSFTKKYNNPSSNLGAFQEDGSLTFYCYAYVMNEEDRDKPYYFYGLEVFPEHELAIPIDLEINIPYVENNDSEYVKHIAEGGDFHIIRNNYYLHEVEELERDNYWHFYDGTNTMTDFDFAEATPLEDGYYCFKDKENLEFNPDDLSVLRLSAHLDYMTVSPLSITFATSCTDYQDKTVSISNSNKEHGISLIYADGTEFVPEFNSMLCGINDEQTEHIRAFLPAVAIEIDGLVAVRYGDRVFPIAD